MTLSKRSLFLLALLWLAGIGQAVVYDLGRDYVMGQNPNGPWSYGKRATLTSPFVLFTGRGTDAYMEWWTDPGASIPYAGFSFGNVEQCPASISYPPRTAVCTTSAQIAVYRWTAPLAGSLRIAALATAVNKISQRKSLDIIFNGVIIYTNIVTVGSPVSYLSATPLSIHAGDTLDFAVGASTDGLQYDETSLAVRLYVNESRPVYQPDAAIRPWGSIAYRLENVVNTTGEGQNSAATPFSGEVGMHVLKVVNAGSSSDRFTLTAPPTPAGWTVRYYDAVNGGTNITAQITGGGWTTGVLAPFAAQYLRVEVTPPASAAGGTSLTRGITVTSVSDTTKSDAVLAVTTSNGPPPAYDVARDFSTTQNPNGAWSYGWKATMDGAFQLYGAQGVTTGQLNYWSIVNNTIIPRFTPGILYNATNGDAYSDYATSLLPARGVGLHPGPQNQLSVIRWTAPTPCTATVKATFTGRDKVGTTTGIYILQNGSLINSGAVSGYLGTYGFNPTLPLMIKAGDTLDFVVGYGANGHFHNDLTGADIQISTVMLPPQPDLMVRGLNEATYVGDDVYNLDGNGQTKERTIAAGSTVAYAIKAQNDSYTTQTLCLTASSLPAGWSFTAVDAGNNTDITAALKGAGWRVKLAPQASRGYYVTVAVAPGTPVGRSSNLVITATVPDVVGSQVDAVNVISTVVAPVYQPDVQLRLPGETTYSGNNIYSPNGAGQIRTQSCANAGATYYYRIQSDSNTADTLVVTGSAGGGGFYITYLTEDQGLNITALVTGAGWRVSNLGQGSYVGLIMQVVPASTTLPGASRATILTARSVGYPTLKDVAKTNTTVVVSYQPDCWIRTLTDTASIGDNLYTTDGTGQTRAQSNIAGNKVAYQVRVQHDGNTVDSYLITAASSGAAWPRRYFVVETGQEITTQMAAGGWTLGPLTRGQYKTIRVEVTPNTSYAIGAAQTLTLAAISTTSTFDKRDVVKAVTTRR